MNMLKTITMSNKEIKDFEVGYSVDDLNGMLLNKFYRIIHSISEFDESILSPNDKIVLKNIEDLKDRPYSYAMNPDAFILGNEEAAIQKEMEIFEIYNAYDKIIEKVSKVYENFPNMLKTKNSYIEIMNNRVKK